MVNGDLSQILEDGINAARRGDRNTGRRLLQQVIDSDPDNEMAWIWMASCVTTLVERRNCLERVLEINPNNSRAQQALQALGSSGRNLEGGTAETIEQSRQTRRQTTSVSQGGSRGGIDLINILIALFAILAVVGGVFLFSSDISPFNQPEPTPTPIPPTRILNTSTPLPPPPTRAPVLFEGTSFAPTLPPTFTPTPTDLPSATPFPTETPFPLSEFVAYYTSLGMGDSQPSLYQINGAGGDESQVGQEVRNIALTLSGDRIAFIRNVEYPAEDDGDPEMFPELFVADVNDLANAQQVTELKTSIVSSPTWSPEGQEIIFVNDFDGSEDLWYVTPDGQNLRRLTENEEFIDRDPAWEPILGSRRILFASDRESIGTTKIFEFELFDPGEEPTFTRLTSAANRSYAPSFSHDGSLIAFISDRRGDADVFYMFADGTGATLVTLDDGDAEDRNPGFTPDGRFIAFISNREDDRFQTYLVSLDGTVLTRVTENKGNDESIVYRSELILRIR